MTHNKNLQNLGEYSLEQLTEMIQREAEAWEIKAGLFNKTWRSSGSKKTFTEVIDKEIKPLYQGQNITIRAGAKDKNGSILNDGTAKIFHFNLPKNDDSENGETVYFSVMGNSTLPLNNQNNYPPNIYPPNYYPPNYNPNFNPGNFPQIILGNIPQQQYKNDPPPADKGISLEQVQTMIANAAEKQSIEYERKIFKMECDHRIADIERKETDVDKKNLEVEVAKEEYIKKCAKFLPEMKDVGGTLLEGLYLGAKSIFKKNTNLGNVETTTPVVTKEDVKRGSKIKIDIPGSNSEKIENKVNDIPVLSKRETVLKLMAEMNDDDFSDTIEEINKLTDLDDDQNKAIEEKNIDNLKNTTNDNNSSNP